MNKIQIQIFKGIESLNWILKTIIVKQILLYGDMNTKSKYFDILCDYLKYYEINYYKRLKRITVNEIVNVLYLYKYWIDMEELYQVILHLYNYQKVYFICIEFTAYIKLTVFVIIL